uniref:Uncharacterized protein n=1 Tax=Cacopsylla melanoneura TaxID=428564 RepID=A0A8D8YDC8_9HEMI
MCDYAGAVQIPRSKKSDEPTSVSDLFLSANYLAARLRRLSDSSCRTGITSSSCASSYTDYCMDSFLGCGAAGQNHVDLTDERELAHRLDTPDLLIIILVVFAYLGILRFYFIFS